MEIALIKNGIVVNRIVANSIESISSAYADYTLVNDEARSLNIGDEYTE